MRLLLVAALLIPAPVLAQLPRSALDARCSRGAGRIAADQRMPRARKLAEMPPAKQFLTVYREVGGCPTPVVVRERIGADAARPAPH